MTSRILSSVAIVSLMVACSSGDSGGDTASGGGGAGTGGGTSGKGGATGGGASGKGGAATAGKGGASIGGKGGAGSGAGGSGTAGTDGTGGSGTAGTDGTGGSGTAGTGTAGSGTAGSGTAGSGGSGTAGSGAAGAGGSALVTYGMQYTGGQYNLGPVDYSESQFHNACAPGTKYAPAVQSAEGVLLAGLWGGIPNVADLCDACIWVTTAKGKSALLRVVTYGDTTPNSIDVSPEAYAILDSGEYPRAMTWQLAECPDTGPLLYEFQTGSNEWWTSLWVRSARVPIAKVEVKSVNHASFVPLQRAGDGTLTDASGFGAGPFTIRVTGIDGKQVSDTFDWPAAGIAGAFLTGAGTF
jgi:expansin (peptidoglycan-binding protein)